MTKPLVTIAIPSYNYGRWLSEAIESALGQTYRNVEVIVVDDTSSDDSLTIAERYAAAHPQRVRVVAHPGGAHRGISVTTNRGIGEARGVYWGALPADDVLCPSKIERQVELLEAKPELALVYGRTRAVDADGDAIEDQPLLGLDVNRHPRPLEWLLHANEIPAVSVLARRDALSRFVPGLFREALIYGDWYVWIRLVAHGAIAFLPDVVAHTRIHGANSSWGSDEALDRRRTLDVLRTVESDADEIGGGLANARIRAALRLELALGCHRDGAFDEADRWAAAAFAADRSIEGDAGWLNAWLRERSSRFAAPDDAPARVLAHAPVPLQAALAGPVRAVRLEQEARAAERDRKRRAGLRLATRLVRVEASRLADPTFLRLLARLAVGPRLTAIVRRRASCRRPRVGA